MGKQRKTMAATASSSPTRARTSTCRSPLSALHPRRAANEAGQAPEVVRQPKTLDALAREDQHLRRDADRIFGERAVDDDRAPPRQRL